MKNQRGEGEAAMLISIVFAVLIVLGLLFFGLPAWNVWRAGLSGESELKQATWNRQIGISHEN